MAKRRAAPAAATKVSPQVHAGTLCAHGGGLGTCYQQASTLRDDGLCYAHGKAKDLSPPTQPTRWLSAWREKGSMIEPAPPKAKKGRPVGHVGRQAR